QPVGDRLLVEVAGRLGEAAGDSELVARLGGASFGVVLPATHNRDDLLDRVDAVRRSLDEPFQVDGHLFTSACTVGHAVAPTDGDDARTLVRSAKARVQQIRSESLPVLTSSGPVEGRGLLEELRTGLAD